MHTKHKKHNNNNNNNNNNNAKQCIGFLMNPYTCMFCTDLQLHLNSLLHAMLALGSVAHFGIHDTSISFFQPHWLEQGNSYLYVTLSTVPSIMPPWNTAHLICRDIAAFVGAIFSIDLPLRL